MEIILAKHLGFCYGVKRAIKMARAEGKCFTLGPIIHNPQMVAQLATEGVGTINNLSELSSGTVIIRSHGVGPEVYAEAETKHLNLVDATCPFVKKAQLSAHELVKEGYFVVIIGEKRHPEVKSILEWSEQHAVVIESVEEAQKLSSYPRIGIVAQTTFSHARFKEIVDILLDKAPELKIVRTICTATDQRQSAAAELAAQVDMMLVIGGRNSANTTRLAHLCAEKCPTHHIETADELQNIWFKNINRIGITAGASTPDWIIQEVYTKCMNMNKSKA